MTEKQGMSRSARKIAGIAAIAAVPGAMSSFIISSLRAAERHERACLELEVAVKRIQPMLTPEGFVKLEDLARVAAQFRDVRGFLGAVGVVLGSQIVCQCWWCKLKRWVHSIVGKLIVWMRDRQ